MKRVLSVLLALTLALTLWGCGKDGGAEDKTLGLAQWELTAAAWSSNNGATVTLTATPNFYEKGMSAAFEARLEGETIESMPCEVADKTFTASLDLNAADGYCYYVILTAPSGETLEVEVNTPNSPTDQALINMAHSLNAYCQMAVQSHALNGDLLTITGGKAEVGLPQITRDGKEAACQGAQLVLYYNEDEEVGRADLPLGQDLSNIPVQAINFTIPKMEDEEQLNVVLEVTLTDGQVLTAPGGNWIYNNGQLVLAIG